MEKKREKIRIRFYRCTIHPTEWGFTGKWNKQMKGAFTKEFNSIRELKEFIRNTRKSNLYCVNLCEDLTPSQYQSFCQNNMNKVDIKRTLDKRQANNRMWDEWITHVSFEELQRMLAETYKKDVKRQKKAIKECNKRR